MSEAMEQREGVLRVQASRYRLRTALGAAAVAVLVTGGAWLASSTSQLGRGCAEEAPAEELLPTRARVLATGLGVTYDPAVALVVEINDLLERKHAELARREVADAREVVNELRREVGALEERYAQAISARVASTRHGAQRR